MHRSAFAYCRDFVEKYGDQFVGEPVLDVGSLDINGTVRRLFDEFTYVGLDQIPGKNVDVVCADRNYPFNSGGFGAAVSTSCFEHDTAFWKTFAEMVRVVRSGGFIYLNAPSNGPYHGYPGDCWRFYADAWGALAKETDGVELVESYMGEKSGPAKWIDNVGVFRVG